MLPVPRIPQRSGLLIESPPAHHVRRACIVAVRHPDAGPRAVQSARSLFRQRWLYLREALVERVRVNLLRRIGVGHEIHNGIADGGGVTGFRGVGVRTVKGIESVSLFP